MVVGASVWTRPRPLLYLQASEAEMTKPDSRRARPSLYEFAGGEQAFLALAAATHERCLQDPELNHPFSHGLSPRHVENLAAYWAEVLGGPPRYSNVLGGHSGMLTIHAGQGAPDEMGDRFETCFIRAMDDAELPDEPEFRRALSGGQHEMVASYVSALSKCRY